MVRIYRGKNKLIFMCVGSSYDLDKRFSSCTRDNCHYFSLYSRLQVLHDVSLFSRTLSALLKIHWNNNNVRRSAVRMTRFSLNKTIHMYDYWLLSFFATNDIILYWYVCEFVIMLQLDVMVNDNFIIMKKQPL